MKTFRIILISGLALIIFGNLSQAAIDLASLIPEKIGEWSLKYKPDLYVGDDLFLYINGGAEIYHEFGFNRVVSLTYTNRESKSINVDIYQMSDPGAAYGVYRFKSSPKGKQVTIGDSQGIIQDYYLNVWKGAFKITLVGFDAREETREGLLRLAKEVVKHLPASNDSPPGPIADFLTRFPKPFDLKYLRGEITLFNLHKFSKTNLFEFREGVAGLYKNHKILIFHYKDENHQKKILKRSEDYYSKKEKKRFKSQENGYQVLFPDYLMEVTGQDKKLFIFLGDPSLRPKILPND